MVRAMKSKELSADERAICKQILSWVDHNTGRIRAVVGAFPQYREREVRNAVERMVDRGLLQLGLDMELIRSE